MKRWLFTAVALNSLDPAHHQHHKATIDVTDEVNRGVINPNGGFREMSLGKFECVLCENEHLFQPQGGQFGFEQNGMKVAIPIT